MRIIFLLLLFIVLSVHTFHIDDGCEAKEKWDIVLKWTSLNISAWIPVEQDAEVLTIELELRGQSFPHTYDKLELWNDEIVFKQKRDGNSKTQSFNISTLGAEQWADFIFSVDTHYNFMYLKTSKETLMKVKVDHLPKALSVKGNNVTLNCNSDLRVWKVSERPVLLPLDDREEHRLSFFSTENFTVFLEIEERAFSLGWYNGELTMIPVIVQPLPPFEEHLLQIVCQNNTQTTCDLKTGQNGTIAEQNIRMSNLPRSLLVKGNPGDSFYAILHVDVDSASPAPSPSEDEKFYAVLIGHYVFEVLCCTIIVILVVIVIRNRKVITFGLFTTRRHEIGNENGGLKNGGRYKRCQTMQTQNTAQNVDTAVTGQEVQPNDTKKLENEKRDFAGNPSEASPARSMEGTSLSFCTETHDESQPLQEGKENDTTLCTDLTLSDYEGCSRPISLHSRKSNFSLQNEA